MNIDHKMTLNYSELHSFQKKKHNRVILKKKKKDYHKYKGYLSFTSDNQHCKGYYFNKNSNV